MNVTCPECRSMFRVDPARLPETPVRARCAVCGGVIPIAPTTSLRDDFAATPARATAAPPALEPSHRFSSAPTPVIPMQAAPSTAEERPAIEPAAAAAPAPVAPPVSPPPAAPAPSVPPAVPAPVVPPVVPPVAPAVAAPVPTPAPAPPTAAPVTRPAPPAGMPPRAPAPPVGSRPSPPARPPFAAPASGARPAQPFNPGSAARPAGLPAAPGAARPAFGAPAARPSGPATPTAIPAAPAGSPAPSRETPSTARRPVNPFLANDPNAKARRLARALISDMVTYFPDKHRQAVESGTLKDTFEEEIRKSYQEYVEQIGKEFADSTTHFQEALNEILARGQRLF